MLERRAGHKFSLTTIRKGVVMSRDIDHAAIAVKKAVGDKFARQVNLEGLEVQVQDRTIRLSCGGRAVEGTRDELMTAIRMAENFDQLWSFEAARLGGHPAN